MDKNCRGKRPSEEQEQFLISYLEENLDLAHDRFQTVDGAKQKEAEWKKLSENLNAIGGAFKDPSKWRKFWTDLRLHTKSNAQKIKSGVNGRGLKPLSDLEERVIKIMNFRNIDGDLVTRDLGFNPIGEIMLNVEDEIGPLSCRGGEASTSRAHAEASISTVPAETSSTVPAEASSSTVPAEASTSTTRPQQSSRRPGLQGPIRRRRTLNTDTSYADFLKLEEKKILLDT